ncbi:hypothetical protein ACL1F6_12105 [Corynebacterium striatum]
MTGMKPICLESKSILVEEFNFLRSCGDPVAASIFHLAKVYGLSYSTVETYLNRNRKKLHYDITYSR